MQLSQISGVIRLDECVGIEEAGEEGHRRWVMEGSSVQVSQMLECLATNATPSQAADRVQEGVKTESIIRMLKSMTKQLDTTQNRDPCTATNSVDPSREISLEGCPHLKRDMEENHGEWMFKNSGIALSDVLEWIALDENAESAAKEFHEWVSVRDIAKVLRFLATKIDERTIGRRQKHS